MALVVVIDERDVILPRLAEVAEIFAEVLVPAADRQQFFCPLITSSRNSVEREIQCRVEFGKPLVRAGHRGVRRDIFVDQIVVADDLAEDEEIAPCQCARHTRGSHCKRSPQHGLDVADGVDAIAVDIAAAIQYLKHWIGAVHHLRVVQVQIFERKEIAADGFFAGRAVTRFVIDPRRLKAPGS